MCFLGIISRHRSSGVTSYVVKSRQKNRDKWAFLFYDDKVSWGHGDRMSSNSILTIGIFGDRMDHFFVF